MQKFGPYVLVNAKKFQSLEDIFVSEYVTNSLADKYDLLDSKNLLGTLVTETLNPEFSGLVSERINEEAELPFSPSENDTFDNFDVHELMELCYKYIQKTKPYTNEHISNKTKLFLLSKDGNDGNKVKGTVVQKALTGELMLDSKSNPSGVLVETYLEDDRAIDFELFDDSESFFVMRMKKMDNSSIDITPSLPLQVMHSTFSGESWKIKLIPTVEGAQGVDTHQEGISMLGLLLTFKRQ